ncbi:MAG: helix-turn-helix domain-containing protein [Solirubrobacterales bacterium]|nr:helix-turn-helix domain-containing protein [Solirubrobacterales bacterium]
MSTGVKAPRLGRSEGAPAGSLTLGDLLGEVELGLKLVAGLPACAQRTVAGALVMTTGGTSDVHTVPRGAVTLLETPPLDDSAARCRVLVTRLSQRGASGLGVALRHEGEGLPRALTDEAAAQGFPIFTLPVGMPCDKLVRFVEAALAQSEIQIMRRSLSAQEYLMDALGDARPTRALVRRLGWLLGGEALLFNDGGHVVAATGVTRAAALWDEIRRRDPEVQHFEVGGRHVTSLPIIVDDRVRFWLVSLTRREISAQQPGLSVLRVAERLLELVARARVSAEAEDQALRTAVLAAALGERDRHQADEIEHRAARFGITFSESCRVLVAKTGEAKGQGTPQLPRTPDLAERLRQSLAVTRSPYLLGENDEGLVALIQGSCRGVDEWVHALHLEGVEVEAGLGRAHHSLDETHQSLLDARLAVQQIAPRGRAAVLRFEDCHLARWLVGGVAKERIAPQVAGLLGKVKEDPRLYETLVAYLDADLDLRTTALVLHLHVNSVRYRLGKVEAILGRPLSSVATLADLHIAVTVDRVSPGGYPPPLLL